MPCEIIRIFSKLILPIAELILLYRLVKEELS